MRFEDAYFGMRIDIVSSSERSLRIYQIALGNIVLKTASAQ
jgi:hypothetical protein